MTYTYDFLSVFEGFGSLLDGLVMTIKLTISANIIGLLFGFVLALFTRQPLAVVRMPAMLFIEFFRCTPVIIQIIWFFYCVPMIFDVYLSSFTMGVLALGLNLAAFNAEAYRAAIQAVPRDQLDAGIALGLTPLQRIRHIILPASVRAAAPVLVSNGILIFQQTALVAIVAVQDLMYAGKSLATETYRPIETFTVVAVIYFAVSFPLSQVVGYLERRRDAVAQ